jgi:hypothetical protein
MRSGAAFRSPNHRVDMMANSGSLLGPLGVAKEQNKLRINRVKIKYLLKIYLNYLYSLVE